MTGEIQIQKIVINHFEEVSDKDYIEIVDYFVYEDYSKGDIKKRNVISDFLVKNELVNDFADYLKAKDAKEEGRGVCFFNARAVEMIEVVKTAMLNDCYNRFRRAQQKRDVRFSKLRKNFLFVKKEIIEIYERLNSNEEYFYGRSEDSKLIEKIKKMP